MKELIPILLIISIGWLFSYLFWGSLQIYSMLVTSQLSPERGTGAHPGEASEFCLLVRCAETGLS